MTGSVWAVVGISAASSAVLYALTSHVLRAITPAVRRWQDSARSRAVDENQQ